MLDKLGVDIFGLLYLKFDGMFFNYIFNLEDKIVMVFIRVVVLENLVDFGIVFDIDVDWSGVVDNWGNLINGDKLIVFMLVIVFREYLGSIIVIDVWISIVLFWFIISWGGWYCLYWVGYRNVIDKGV